MGSNCIFRIFASSSLGCGFVVGQYFITAYHVVEGFDACICIGGKRIPLKKECAVFCDFDDEACPGFVSEHDLAIFALSEFAELESPLSIGAEMPLPETRCISKSYVTRVVQHDDSVFGWQSEEVLTECKATVNGDRYECLFAADMDMMLLPGCSGSPLLDGNMVVGMLLGCDDSKPYACFLSAKIIAEAILLQKNSFV